MKVTAGGGVTVQALENASLHAEDRSRVSTSADAKGGAISLNMVNSDAAAEITRSEVTTEEGGGGDVLVEAKNTALIDAESTTKTESGDKTIGVVVSLNTVGYDSSNILFSVVESLLGTDALSPEPPSSARAWIENSTVKADGDVSVIAENASQLNATTGNEQVVKAINTLVLDAKGKSSMAGGGLLALNKVSSVADAYIGPRSTDYLAGQAIDELSYGRRVMLEDGSLFEYIGEAVYDPTILGETADAYSAENLWRELTDLAGEYLGESEVEAGGAVTVSAQDASGIDANSRVVSTAITENTLKGIIDILDGFLPDDYQYTTASGTQTVYTGDPVTGMNLVSQTRVRVGENYTKGGEAGAVYKFVGNLSEEVDLRNEDYSNGDRWTKITGGVDDLSDRYPNLGNLTNSDAKAYGLLGVINEVRSDVSAYVENTTVNAGSVSVTASSNASIQSFAESNVNASGGSAFGEGEVLAVNGQLVVNMVDGKTVGYIEDSTITTTNETTSGDVNVSVKNASTLDATLHAVTNTGDKGYGVTLALNTLGWSVKDLLFNTIDTLIGEQGVADVFGEENPAKAHAYIQNTPVTAAGDLTVTAVNESNINATISNAAESTASALYGATGMNVGAVVAMNQISSGAEAFIADADESGDIDVEGSLIVFSEDNAEFYANV
ncbi:MAG: hypothetical protein ACP5I1_00650, partial [Candidatus Hinthialibacter sp.]